MSSSSKNDEKKKRQGNFTRNERQILVKLANKHKNIIENKKTDGTTWREKEAIWQKLEQQFNSIGGGEPRTAKQLKFKYEAIKKEMKKDYANHKNYVRGTGGGKRIPSPIPKTEEEKDLLETIAFSVTGLDAELDSDALAGIEGIPFETVEEIEVVSDEIGVDWSFPAASYLQTKKHNLLQTAKNEVEKFDEHNIITNVTDNHDYCKTPKSNIVKSPETLDTPGSSSHWSTRRRPQIPKKHNKCISSAGAKFEDLAEKKMCLVKKTIEEKGNKEAREKIEHELRVKNLLLENEILQLKKELAIKQLELI